MDSVMVSVSACGAARNHHGEVATRSYRGNVATGDEAGFSCSGAKHRRYCKALAAQSGDLPPPPLLSIARRIYPDYTTESYREAMLAAWIMKRSMLPYVARLGPGVEGHIASFLLEITPAPPPMRAEAMEGRRRLERLEDLLNNPLREEDLAEIRREERHSMRKIVKARHGVLQQMTRASIMFQSARQWLEKEDMIGLVPRPRDLDVL